MIVFMLSIMSCSGEISQTPASISPILPTEETLAPDPTETSTPQPSPTESRNEIQVVSYTQLPSLPEGASIQGLIVIGDQSDNFTSARYAYLIDGQTGEKILDLPPYPTPVMNEFSYFSSSPDGKWLAYFSWEGNQETLYVVDANGQILMNLLIRDREGNFLLDTQLPGGTRLDGYIYWLDNERLMTEKWPKDETLYISEQTYSAVLIEPRTGFIQNYPAVYPQITTSYVFSSQTWDNGGYSGMVFDPAMTRVVYGTDHMGVNLWDMENQKIIVEFPPRYSYSLLGGPVWNRDGSMFVIELPGITFGGSEDLFELVLVDRNGEMNRLTYFSDQFSNSNLLRLPAWSPDEEKVAVLAGLTPNPCENEWFDLQPVVIDLYTMTSTIYCILDTIDSPGRLIWSADGTQLLLATSTGYVGEFSTVLLDIKAGYAAMMYEDSIPLAVMSDVEE